MEKTNKAQRVVFAGLGGNRFLDALNKSLNMFRPGNRALHFPIKLSLKAAPKVEAPRVTASVGIIRGGFTFHNHASKTFKKHQRIERKISRRRGMKASAR